MGKHIFRGCLGWGVLGLEKVLMGKHIFRGFLGQGVLGTESVLMGKDTLALSLIWAVGWFSLQQK